MNNLEEAIIGLQRQINALQGRVDVNLSREFTPSAQAATPGTVVRRDADGDITITELHALGSIRESTALGAHVYYDAAQSIVDSTVTVLTFNSERFDTDDCHSNSVNPTRLTCRTSGIYAISGHVRFASNATGTRRLLLRLNGATFIAEQGVPALSGSITGISVAVAAYPLSANDYIELVVLQTSGGNLDVQSVGNVTPEFSMVRVP